MSVQSIYMDDGVTETDDFKTLWQCLESEIEHYEDILKAKLVSLLLHLFNYPLATAVSLLCNWLTITCNCRQFTCNCLTIHLQLLPAYFAIGQLYFHIHISPPHCKRFVSHHFFAVAFSLCFCNCSVSYLQLGA